MGPAEGRSRKEVDNFSKLCLFWTPHPLANHLNKVELGQDKPKSSNKSLLFQAPTFEDGIP